MGQSSGGMRYWGDERLMEESQRPSSWRPVRSPLGHSVEDHDRFRPHGATTLRKYDRRGQGREPFVPCSVGIQSRVLPLVGRTGTGASMEDSDLNVWLTRWEPYVKAFRKFVSNLPRELARPPASGSAPPSFRI